MIDVEKIIREFNYAHGWHDRDTQFVSDLRKGGLTDTQIALVLYELDNICHYCWDDDSGCQCMNCD